MTFAESRGLIMPASSSPVLGYAKTLRHVLRDLLRSQQRSGFASCAANRQPLVNWRNIVEVILVSMIGLGSLFIILTLIGVFVWIGWMLHGAAF